MKVTLVFPRMEGPWSTTATLADAECLGLGYLASSLRAAGHEVTLVNAELENLGVPETTARCLEAEPDIVGCSPVSLSINSTLTVLEGVRERMPNVITVLGGHLASLDGKAILVGEPSVDIVVRGDAEQSFPALLSAGKDASLYRDIPGVLWRDSTGRVHESARAPEPVALDSIPFPARDDLRTMTLTRPVHAARMVASRGCKYSCSFCTTPQFYGRTVRMRSPKSIVEEMNYLADAFGVGHIWFNDDLFIDGSPRNTRWVEELCGELDRNRQSFTFRILCRADSFTPINQHLMGLLRAAGLTHVFLGLEAGAEAALAVYNKGFSVSQALDAVANIRSRGLQLQIGFIM